MGVSEAVSQGLEVTVTGLVVVFSVLVILMLVLVLMRVVFYKEPKEEAVSEKSKSVPSAAVREPQAPPKSAKQTDDGELIAVITVAVAASLNTSTYNLKVKSFRRISDNSPLWNKAGRTDVINSRF